MNPKENPCTRHYAEGAGRVTPPPCQKLTIETDGVDGGAYMYSNCYDFCVKHCRWPGDKDTMHCWAAYYRAESKQEGRGIHDGTIDL